MKDRIQIDGVWYVKEQEDTKPEKLDLTHTRSCIYETEKYCFNASKIYKDGVEEFYDGIDIDFTDKRKGWGMWKEEHWDHTAWMIGVYENNPDSLVHARESMDEEGIKQFRLFVGELKKMGWI